MRQLNLDSVDEQTLNTKPPRRRGKKKRTTHGGGLFAKKRKEARPIELEKAHHFIFRSQRAKGRWNLLKNCNRSIVDKTIFVAADKFQIKIYRFANSGNHLHILLKAPSLKALHRFLKRVTGIIALKVTGARKGLRVGRFWDSIPFSRIVTWGRDFNTSCVYVIQNLLEAIGIIPSRCNANDQHLTPRRIKFIESMFDEDAIARMTAIERILNRIRSAL